MSTLSDENKSCDDNPEPLTDSNVHFFEQEDIPRQKKRRASQWTYADEMRHWDGVRDFNKESTFAHGTDVREHVNKKRWSDSSADYSDCFKKADAASQSVDSERLSSLKLYRTYQSTESPIQRWCTSTTSWPDRVGDLQLSKGHNEEPVEVQEDDTPAAANIDTLKRRSSAVEIDDETESTELSPTEVQRVMKRSRTYEPGHTRVRRAKRALKNRGSAQK